MRCPFCGNMDSKVVDSRVSDDGASIRRRRECTACGKRYTTYEKVESTPILVIKNNGTRQIFDINKIKNGIIKACEKRPVSMAKIDSGVHEALFPGNVGAGRHLASDAGHPVPERHGHPPGLHPAGPLLAQPGRPGPRRGRLDREHRDHRKEPPAPHPHRGRGRGPLRPAAAGHGGGPGLRRPVGGRRLTPPRRDTKGKERREWVFSRVFPT